MMRWQEKFLAKEDAIERAEVLVYERREGHDFRVTATHAVLAKDTVHATINRAIFQYSLHYVSRQLHQQANDLNLRRRCESLLKLHMDRVYRRPGEGGPHCRLSETDLDAIARAKRSLRWEADEARVDFNRDHFAVNHYLFAGSLYHCRECDAVMAEMKVKAEAKTAWRHTGSNKTAKGN